MVVFFFTPQIDMYGDLQTYFNEFISIEQNCIKSFILITVMN